MAKKQIGKGKPKGAAGKPKKSPPPSPVKAKEITPSPRELRDAQGRTRREFDCELAQRIADAIAAIFGPSESVNGAWKNPCTINAETWGRIERHIRTCFDWLSRARQHALDTHFIPDLPGAIAVKQWTAQKYGDAWEKIFKQIDKTEHESLGWGAVGGEQSHTTRIQSFIDSQRRMIEFMIAHEKGNCCQSAEGAHGIWLPAERKRSPDYPLAIIALAFRVHDALPNSFPNRTRQTNELLKRLGLLRPHSTEAALRAKMLGDWLDVLPKAEEHARKQRGGA